MLDGVLLLDKAADMTSHDAVACVRRAIGQKAVGHTGTLDPLATGLMILVLGEGTKLSDYLISAEKSYRVKVRLGVTTDTLDRTGEVLSEKPCDFTPEQLREAVNKLQGEFDWQVPLFSAAKVAGRKLYEYGRQGEDVERPTKRMAFWDARVVEVDSSSRLEVELKCSKGSFIRSWAAQLGENLGVGGIVEELRRLSVGSWTLENALTLEDIEARKGELGDAFKSLNEALPDLKSVMAGPKEAKLMLNGQIPRDIAARLIFEQKAAIASGESVYVKVLTQAGDLLAILAAEARQGLKIRRVFRPFP